MAINFTPLTPATRGYIAGMFDLKGNAYTAREGGLVAYINGVKDEQLQKDLKRWIGGGTIRIDTYDGDRRGCATHCDSPHFHYTRTSARYVVSGYRALILLYNLEDMMFSWSSKFADPFTEAMQRVEEVSTTKDGMKIAEDMQKRGWDLW